MAISGSMTGATALFNQRFISGLINRNATNVIKYKNMINGLRSFTKRLAWGMERIV